MAFKQNNNPLSRKSSPLNGDWIKGAIKRPGAFRKKAEEAGMSTKAFADKVIANKDDYSTRTGQQAELAETLMSMSRHESGHYENPEQGDFDYEDPNYRDTPEYKKFLRKQKRQERKNKRKGPKRGEPGFEQDPQEAALEQSYLETYGESISRKASPLNAEMGGELEEVVIEVDRDRSKKGIKERKTKDKEEGKKSKSEIRLDKTKDKVAKAKKATVESKDIESQKENRAKANRLRKRQIRQEGRAERKKARKSKKFRENKRQAIIKSRREQKERIRDVK